MCSTATADSPGELRTGRSRSFKSRKRLQAAAKLAMLALQRDPGRPEATERPRQTRHAYSSVLHELIYALMGLTGDVFVDARPSQVAGKVCAPNKSLFHVSEEASWLSTADRAELEDLLRLGYHYAEIDRFVQGNQDPLSAQSKPGAWQALASGLEGAHTLYARRKSWCNHR